MRQGERSQALHARALRAVPAGTHSNSRVREPHPIYGAHAKGAYVWDADDRRWTDFTMGNASVFLGHGDPYVEERVVAAIRDGVGAGFESELAVEAAERFLDIVTSVDQVRFTNTGTEAAMHAVHAARAATGRTVIAKIEGAYHGWWDELFVSTWPPIDQAGAADAPRTVPGGGGLRNADGTDGTVVLPFNNVVATEALLDRHGPRLAAVILEPALIDIGFVPPDPAYLRAIRAACDRHGVMLIFDELLTGFRVAPGGAQAAYGVRADLSLWGKAMANGFPVAALAGSEEAMSWTLPGPGRAPYVGTFNGYRPAMAACAATLDRLADGSVLEGVRARSDSLKDAFVRVAERHGVAAILHGEGGHVQPYFTDAPVVDYRSAARSDPDRYAQWARSMVRAGVLVAPKPLLHGAFSAAHDDEAFEVYLAASEEAFRTMPS